MCTIQVGFTLLETVIALTIMTTALLGLVPLAATSVRVVADARDETWALILAATRLEELSALPFDQDGRTRATTTDTTTGLAGARATVFGTGLQPTRADALWQDVSGSVDRMGADGAETDADAALFIRRWGVGPVASTSYDAARLVQTFARARAREERERARGSPARRPGDVWLFSVRARVLR